MNRRALLGGFLAIVCLATLWGVWGQRSQLACAPSNSNYWQ